MGLTRMCKPSPRHYRSKRTLTDQLVQPITLTRYRRALRSFFQYWDLVGTFDVTSLSALDDAAAMYKQMYSDGEPKSLASYF